MASSDNVKQCAISMSLIQEIRQSILVWSKTYPDEGLRGAARRLVSFRSEFEPNTIRADRGYAFDA